MNTARLEISNDCRIDIGAEELANFILMLPEERASIRFFDVLARHPAATVRKAVAASKPLSDETVALLAKDKTQGVLLELIKNNTASERIAKSAINGWIASGDADLISELFDNVACLPQIDVQHFYFNCAEHDDPSIRLQVALSSETSIERLEQFIHDGDPSVREAAADTLNTKRANEDDEDWEK